MPVLDEILALSLVEQGSRLAPLDRAVLLASCFGAMSADAAAELALDWRDRVLIDARIAAFGPTIGFFARCPSCGEGNEATFDLRALPEPEAKREVTWTVAGRELLLLAPTSQAVAAAVRADEPQQLLAACVGTGCFPLEPGFAESVESALAQAFPLLDVRFDISCSACEAKFRKRFDIVAWLWREIEALAACAVDLVDRLARAYGWSEREILELSPARRSLYLAKVAG